MQRSQEVLNCLLSLCRISDIRLTFLVDLGSSPLLSGLIIPSAIVALF